MEQPVTLIIIIIAFLLLLHQSAKLLGKRLEINKKIVIPINNTGGTGTLPKTRGFRESTVGTIGISKYKVNGGTINLDNQVDPNMSYQQLEFNCKRAANDYIRQNKLQNNDYTLAMNTYATWTESPSFFNLWGLFGLKSEITPAMCRMQQGIVNLLTPTENTTPIANTYKYQL